LRIASNPAGGIPARSPSGNRMVERSSVTGEAADGQLVPDRITQLAALASA
jgi:hypothetical protein